MPGHDIIVVGASAGGVETLKHLVRDLPRDLPAALMVVVHLSPQSPGFLPAILERAGALPARAPKDYEAIEPGQIYVAPPDRHLLVEQGTLRVVHGPKENRHRPAIDPLFRSAAWMYGPRVAGVILSGTLDDGTAGLWAVKSCGGVTVVQDPVDAMYPGMPANALRSVQVDHCLPLEKLPALLIALAHEPAKSAQEYPVPENVKTETKFAMLGQDMKDMDKLGIPSTFTCPACHGSMWELKEGDLVRYRCHVGHAYSVDSLIADQSEVVEDALFAALRALEEKAGILRRIGSRYAGRQPLTKGDYEARAAQLDQRANVLRELLAQKDG